MKFSALFIFSLLICATTAFAFQATPTQTQLSPEAAQIDQLLKEIRGFYAQSKFEEAMPKAKEALALSQKIGDKVRQARSLMQVGLITYHSGQSLEAVELYKQAATAAAEGNDKNLQANATFYAASFLKLSGMDEEAIYLLFQVLEMRREQKNRRSEASTLFDICEVYLYTGHYSEAQRYLQEGFAIAKELNDARLEFNGLMNLGTLQYFQENYAESLQTRLKLLALDPTLANSGQRLTLRQSLGNTYEALEDHTNALMYLSQALAAAREIKAPVTEAEIMTEMANVYFKMSRHEEAINQATQALSLLQQNEASQHFALAPLTALAVSQRALGQLDKAIVNYQRAIAALEQARSLTLPDEVTRGGLVSQYHKIFAETIDLLVSQKREETALEIAERYHARAFLDVLAESRVNLVNPLNAAQKKRESELFARIANVQKELWQPALSAERAAQVQKELQTAENDLSLFQSELRRTNPRYASVKYPQPLKPADIAKELLKPDSALIEFVLGEKKSFAWVVRPGKVSAFTLPASKDVTTLISQYRAALDEKVSSLNAAQATAKLNAIGQQLYQQLLQPMEAQLTGARELIFVPDGALVYLPFETLVCNAAAKKQEYLLERYAISYAPSASALAALKTTAPAANNSSKGVIAFGDAIYAEDAAKPASTALAMNSARAFDLRNIPYTRREVSEIAALFPRSEQQTFLGAEAREANVKTASLDKFRYIHFAAHGIVDENFPARSGIVLTAENNSKEDGVLQMSEVMRLKLNADLVTLSACRTGLGKLLNGEGMIGLTRAFLYAGADSVVVSLWNVNDAATASLMKSFYKNLQQGQAKDEALRQAKLTMLKGQQRAWQHPYYWAAFVLVGEQQ